MPHRARWRHLLLPVTFFWVFFGLASVQTFVVPYLREQFRMREGFAVTVLASIYLILGVSRFFISHVIQRIEKKATILLGVWGYVLFPLLLLFGNGFALGMAASALLGLGGALLWTASSAQVLDVSEKDAYGRASGILQLFTLMGNALGAWFFGFMVIHRDSPCARAILHGARSAHHWLGGVRPLDSQYAIVFATACLLGVVALGSAVLIPSVRTKTTTPDFIEMAKFVTSRERLFAPVILMIQFSTYGIMLTFVNQHVEARLGGESVGTIHAWFLGSGAVLSYIAGTVSDRIGRKRTLGGSFAVGALGMTLFAAAWSKPVFALAAVLLGVVFGGVPSVALAYVGDISTPENRPSVHAFVFAWRDFGLVAVCYIRLLLGKSVGASACFLVFAGVFLAVAVWMLLSARAKRRPPAESAIA